MIELFETARLRVAVPGPEHSAEVARFYAENREHLAPWSPALHPSMLSEACWAEESERRLADFRAGREARGFLFPVEAPDRVIGNLSLNGRWEDHVMSAVSNPDWRG